ncbi:MAG: M28 family peptidase, partial [Pyrinomonadaceae bacterium]
ANESLSARIVSPVKDPLVCEAVAWTPGTNGTIVARAYHMIPPDDPTREELDAFFAGHRGRVRGRIVLAGRHQPVPVNFKTPERRLNEEQLKALYDPNRAGQPRAGGTQQQQNAQQGPARVNQQQVSDEVDQFLFGSGALMRVIGSGEPHGRIRAYINRTRAHGRLVPAVVLRNEDYGRVTRIIAGGTPVELEFDIVNRFYPEGRTAYNVIAEIRGTDKRDEVVMLGAHLDAHHLATGATDNAVNCAVVMEAVRVLKVLGVRPRRTIRIGLWSGEEQRVLGSQAYVREHFGTFENPKPDFDRFGGYLNLDTGTARIRGMRVFGPQETADVLRRILAPFADLGVVGAGTYSNRTSPGSDHAAFSVAGLPGVYIDQDPVEYGEATWHTNVDTYERVVEDDAKMNSVVIASAVYHLAMRDDLLPRFGREQMPPPALPTPGPTPAQRKRS